MNDTDPTFGLDDLAAFTGTPVRTVRFYIQEGLVPRPLGLGRGARYGPEHLEALLAIRRWQAEGRSLGAIRSLLSTKEGDRAAPQRRPGDIEVWSHLVLGPGVELRIEPTQAGLSPEAVRELFREVLATVTRFTDKPKESKT